MIQAFNNAIYAAESRNWFTQQCIAVGLVFVVTVLLVLAVTLIIAADVGLDFLVRRGMIKSGFVFYLLAVGDWLIIWALDYFGISFMYYLGPSRKTGFRFLLPALSWLRSSRCCLPMASILTLRTSAGTISSMAPSAP